jgi:CheY-like chemotaxis protein
VVIGCPLCQHHPMSGRPAGARAEVALTVLVVDDHDGFRARTRRLLERDRYRVVEAADGAQAIAQAAAERPDLVLLDVHLPDMTGFEVAAAMRSEGGAGGRPRILLISTHPAHDYAEQIAGSGADGFIDKADLSRSTIAAMLAGTP